MPTYSVSLPWFPGFYNSSLDALIDQEMEQESELLGEHEVYEATQAVWDTSPEAVAA